jgi:hypothetical protein
MGDHLLESKNSITIILEASSVQYKDPDEHAYAISSHASNKI